MEVGESFYRSRWKISISTETSSTSIQASTCFRGSKFTSTYFHGSSQLLPSACTDFHGGRSTSMLFESRPASMHVAPASMGATNSLHIFLSTEKMPNCVEANRSRSNLIWMLMEVAEIVDGSLCGSSWKSVVIGWSQIKSGEVDMEARASQWKSTEGGGSRYGSRSRYGISWE